MNLVGHHKHARLLADLAHAAQLVFGPGAAHGVVRVAHDEERWALLAHHTLEHVEVDAVGAVVVAGKGGVCDAAAVLDDGVGEGVVHGRLDEHGVAFACEAAHGHGEGEAHAGRDDDPLLAGAEAVTATEPVAHGGVVALRRLRVAEDALLRACHQGVDGRLGAAEVHVGHPHRDLVGGVPRLFGTVPLAAVRATPVNDFVEVVLHDFALSFNQRRQGCAVARRSGPMCTGVHEALRNAATAHPGTSSS